MTPTEQLKEEHEAIKLTLKVIEKISQKIDAGEKIDPKHLDMILEFIKVFADKCHHGKEEDVLFPAMIAAGIPREGGPVGVMLHEHEVGRGFVRRMSDGIKRYKKGDRSALGTFASNARGYTELLARHIYKEDNILYPMADSHVPEMRQSEMMEEFEKIEQERIGAGKHEEFHKNLDLLKSVYLK